MRKVSRFREGHGFSRAASTPDVSGFSR